MRTRIVTAAIAALTCLAMAPSITPPAASQPAASTDAVVAPYLTDAGTTIVVFGDDVVDPAALTQELLAPLGLRPTHIFRHALLGFSVDAPASELAVLIAHPDVAYLESDREVQTAKQDVPRGVMRVDAITAAKIGSGATTNVDIAIIDTGIASHSDLSVSKRIDCTDRAALLGVEYILFGCPDGGTDNDGHGTHVAGIAAARDNGSDVVGVAPGARLWAIKVINKTSGGSLADVIAGVDHVTGLASTIEVANVSLVATGTSSAMNDAVAGATDAGIVVVTAAGNASTNASNTTPANSPKAITVSAITDLDGRARGNRSGSCHGEDDTFASYSNYGSVVDIAAPGSCIVSTSRTGGLVEMSGTSMAAPHVAGAAALRIAQRGLGSSSTRSSTILKDLLGTSAGENTTCGYTGSPSNEKLLDLVSGC